MPVSWNPERQTAFVFHLGAWTVLLWPTLKDREIPLNVVFARLWK